MISRKVIRPFYKLIHIFEKKVFTCRKAYGIFIFVEGQASTAK